MSSVLYSLIGFAQLAAISYCWFLWQGSIPAGDHSLRDAMTRRIRDETDRLKKEGKSASEALRMARESSGPYTQTGVHAFMLKVWVCFICSTKMVTNP